MLRALTLLLILTPHGAVAQQNNDFHNHPVFTRVETWSEQWKDPIDGKQLPGEYDGDYSLSVSPTTSLVTDEVDITAKGFQPGQLVLLRARTTIKDVIWQSTAVFSADRFGEVDLRKQAPDVGAYRGVDVMGLFWSMKPTEPVGFYLFKVDEPKYEIQLELMAAGRTLAEAVATRRKRSKTVVMEDVKRDDWIGELYLPDSTTRSPGILVIGGSEGGIPRTKAEQFASKGYAALAIGYWKTGHLRKELADVPLEAFDEALDWMKRHKSIDSGRLAIIGESRGSEAAFLTACNRQDVAAVVGKVPASLVWRSLPPGRSPWTRNSKGLPFLDSDKTYPKTTSMRAIFLDAALNAPADTVIPVERITAPILLVSGTKDATWPSTDFSEMIVDRLKKFDFAYPVQHAKMVDAGHNLINEIQPPLHCSTGGTLVANARGSREAWKAELRFLGTHLKDQLTRP